MYSVRAKQKQHKENHANHENENHKVNYDSFKNWKGNLKDNFKKQARNHNKRHKQQQQLIHKKQQKHLKGISIYRNPWDIVWPTAQQPFESDLEPNQTKSQT